MYNQASLIVNRLSKFSQIKSFNKSSEVQLLNFPKREITHHLYGDVLLEEVTTFSFRLKHKGSIFDVRIYSDEFNFDYYFIKDNQVTITDDEIHNFIEQLCGFIQ